MWGRTDDRKASMIFEGNFGSLYFLKGNLDGSEAWPGLAISLSLYCIMTI